MDKLTRIDIKKLNRSEIFHFIYRHQKTSKQEIAAQLKMSLPTVSQNLKELESLGFLEKNGQFESTGGRKANAISFISDLKLAIGIEITKYWVTFVAIDLYGNVLKQFKTQIPYTHTPTYYQTIGLTLENFVDELGYTPDVLLGVGIAIQGLVSQDHTQVTYGKILDCTGLHINDFKEHIPYSCKLIHDAECAAYSELWFSEELNDAIYLSLSHNLGGAIILSGKIHRGLYGHSGLIEHTVIDPHGLPCYCGKHGCLETYCAASVLTNGTDESLENFFVHLRNNESYYVKKWDTYLSHLALGINNLRITLDCPIILGGHIAPYLITDDLNKLEELVKSISIFPLEDTFIMKSYSTSDVIPVGAGLPYISDFLSSI